MEKVKLFFNKKEGQYGVNWSAKVEIKEAGTYFINCYDEVKDGKFGQYKSGSLSKAEPKDKAPF